MMFSEGGNFFRFRRRRGMRGLSTALRRIKDTPIGERNDKEHPHRTRAPIRTQTKEGLEHKIKEAPGGI